MGLFLFSYPFPHAPSHSLSSRRPLMASTLSYLTLLPDKPGPAYRDRQNPQSAVRRAGGRASRERRRWPLTRCSPPPAPDRVLEPSGPVRWAPSGPERLHAPPPNNLATPLYPSDPPDSPAPSASLLARARLTPPAPPFLRAPAILCVFAQPVASRERRASAQTAGRGDLERRTRNTGPLRPSRCSLCWFISSTPLLLHLGSPSAHAQMKGRALGLASSLWWAWPS